jgi:hypothetical protein
MMNSQFLIPGQIPTINPYSLYNYNMLNPSQLNNQFNRTRSRVYKPSKQKKSRKRIISQTLEAPETLETPENTEREEPSEEIDK